VTWPSVRNLYRPITGRRRTAFVACLLGLLVLQALPADSEVVDPRLWGTDGDVLAMAQSGSTLYVAGSFRSAGSNCGGGVPVAARTGVPIAGFPRVTGSVYAVAADGLGGWYIGGSFSAVGGVPRSNLAHVGADGSVSAWAPLVEANQGVSSLLIHGTTVYVAGLFHSINDVVRNHVAALDSRSGDVLPWNPDADQNVAAMTLLEGRLFLGGEFYTIGGKSRRHLASVNLGTGLATDWDPGADAPVLALASKDHTIFAAGYFFYLGGLLRKLVGAIDAGTGEVTSWDPHADGPYSDLGGDPFITDLVVDDEVVYLAGYFDQVGGRPGGGIAAVDRTTGLATAWSPTLGPTYPGYPPPPCHSVAVRQGTVYVGGTFSTVDGQSRSGVVALDKSTGAVQAWNPRPNGVIYAIAANEGVVYLGGEFGLIWDWRHRAGLAALDLATGALKPWNPNPDGGSIRAIALHEGQVFVGGDFQNIGGQARSYIAALDTLNGEATAWNPGSNGYVKALVANGDVVFAGGDFTQIGGQTRRRLAALDATTGTPTSWNPDADYSVYTLSLSGNALYVGGFFDYVGGQLRKRIAAVDATTGVVSPWNPNQTSGWVNSIVVGGGRVYVGGVFHQIGGRAREGIAALDAATAMATDWNPQLTQWALVYPRVHALALSGSRLYIGGNFSAVGGESRICLAAVDTVAGSPTGWDPGANAYVWSLLAGGNTVFAGGGFSRLGGLPCSGLAGFTDSVALVPHPSELTPVVLESIAPNPTSSTATVRFSLPEAGDVTLDVYDAQGRRVSSVMKHQQHPSGWHDEPLNAEGWPAGVYFCRLAVAGGASVSRRFVVIR
jgi:hypothetical protein